MHSAAQEKPEEAEETIEAVVAKTNLTPPNTINLNELLEQTTH